MHAISFRSVRIGVHQNVSPSHDFDTSRVGSRGGIRSILRSITHAVRLYMCDIRRPISKCIPKCRGEGEAQFASQTLYRMQLFDPYHRHMYKSVMYVSSKTKQRLRCPLSTSCGYMFCHVETVGNITRNVLENSQSIFAIVLIIMCLVPFATDIDIDIDIDL